MRRFTATISCCSNARSLPVCRRGLLLLACLLAGVRLVAAQAIPNPFPASSLSVQTLTNGLRLIVRENPAQPVVAMEIVVRGGAAASERPGLAHLLEHLCFQGTRQFPAPLAPQFALEAAGGACNAVTSRDTTRYFAQAPAEQLDTLIAVLTDVVLAPTLAETRFQHEREVIAAEIAHARANPSAVLIDRAYAASYRQFPYRHAIRGTVEEVAGLTPDEVRDFHRRWYVPGNISVVLVGDITATRASQLIRAAFAQAPPARQPAAPIYAEAAPRGAMTVEHLPAALPTTYQVMAFPVPAGLDLSDLVATSLLKIILADGQDALLPARWANEQIDVRRFGIEYVASRYPGRFFIWAETSPEMALRLQRSTLALLHHLASVAPPAAVIDHAKHHYAMRFLLDNETYAQQAETLAGFEGFGGAEMAARVIPVLHNVSAERLRRSTPTTCLAWITLGRQPKGLN